MPQASERVKAFFATYESNIGGADPATIAAQYGESFVFAGPQGTQAVKRDDFVRVLPKRQAFFTSLGLRSSRVVSLVEASVDDRCVLVRAQWKIAFEAAGAAVGGSSTYFLPGPPGGLRIVFSLDHDDLTKRVQQLGLAPAGNR